MATEEKAVYVPATRVSQRRVRLIKALGGYKTMGQALEEVTANDLRKRGFDPDTLRPLKAA